MSQSSAEASDQPDGPSEASAAGDTIAGPGSETGGRPSESDELTIPGQFPIKLMGILDRRAKRRAPPQNQDNDGR